MLHYNFWQSPTGEQRIYVDGLDRYAEKVFLVPAPDGAGSVRLAAPKVDGAREIIKSAIFQDLADRGIPLEGSPVRVLFRVFKGLAGKPSYAKPPAASFMQARDREKGLRHSGKHDMTATKIQLEVPTTIRVDHREPRQIVELLEQVANLTVVVEHLPVGDYIVTADDRTAVIERKTALDFQVSVQDGRLFDEVARIGLIPEEIIGVVLLEGDPHGQDVTMLPQSVTGAITCISMLQGMVVLATLDYVHTAYAIAKIGHHLHGLGYELPVHKSKPKLLVDQRTYILQALPGVSGELAQRLLDHFGSVRACLLASREDLLKVKGLGPKRVEELWTAINSE